MSKENHSVFNDRRNSACNQNDRNPSGFDEVRRTDVKGKAHTKWYNQHCNGDWEHDFGFAIETLDNPGWAITIDTEGTTSKLKDKPWELNENSATDWYGFKISNGKFEASGDPLKLNFLLRLFREILNDYLNSDNNKEL